MMDLSLLSVIQALLSGLTLAEKDLALWSTVERNMLWIRLFSILEGGSLNKESWSAFALTSIFFSPNLYSFFSSLDSTTKGLRGADFLPVAASLATIRNDADIKLIGHVTWVGSSSAEVGVRMEQMEDGEWKRVCEARFVMVARDAATGRKSAPLNPLVVESKEEKKLYKLGEKNIEVRAKADQDSLFKEPPSKIENNLILNMFLSTVDHKARSFSARVKPDNSAWMTESKLKSIMVCEPEHKNDYNKIFGGLIMEKCLDLAFTNTWVYTGAAE